MWNRRAVISAGVALGVAGCSSRPVIPKYEGPEVTRIVVQKAQRRMYLLNDGTILKNYKVDLGFAPTGDKTIRGDGKTPEGNYLIDRHNPNSSFHLSLGISYPNEKDRAEAETLGKEPGGDIFIHGARRFGDRKGPDWTAGCISVSNKEVEEIYSMVRPGTIITINP